MLISVLIHSKHYFFDLFSLKIVFDREDETHKFELNSYAYTMHRIHV